MENETGKYFRKKLTQAERIRKSFSSSGTPEDADRRLDLQFMLHYINMLRADIEGNYPELARESLLSFTRTVRLYRSRRFDNAA